MRIIKYKNDEFMIFHYDIILTKFEIVTSEEKIKLSDKMSDVLLSLSKIAKELEDRNL